MLVLRQMRHEEYPTYCQYFIADYSQDIATNHGHSMDIAIELAKEALSKAFSNGLKDTPHSMLCIEADIEGEQSLIGYLWHSVNTNDSSTYIYDFFVFPESRGKGVGTLAILALEKQMKAKGINKIQLRVAYHNERALKLYKEVGFAVTGYNMSKTI